MEEEKKDYIIHKVQAGFNYTVYRNDYNGKPYYKIGIEQKQPDGQKLRGYISVRFKNGVEVSDKTRIKIKQGFENFYFSKNDPKHFNPIFYIQINEFEILDDKIQAYNESMQEDDTDIDLF